MSDSRGWLGEILIAAGRLDREQLEAGLEKHRASGQPLGMTLVRMGALDEQTLIRTLAVQLSLPMARLAGKRVAPEVVELVPAELADKHHCFPLFVKEESGGKVLYLGMEDATNLDALDAVADQTGLTVRPVLVATSEIDEALLRARDTEAPDSPIAAEESPGDLGELAAAGDGFDLGGPDDLRGPDDLYGPGDLRAPEPGPGTEPAEGDGARALDDWQPEEAADAAMSQEPADAGDPPPPGPDGADVAEPGGLGEPVQEPLVGAPEPSEIDAEPALPGTETGTETAEPDAEPALPAELALPGTETELPAELALPGTETELALPGTETELALPGTETELPGTETGTETGSTETELALPGTETAGTETAEPDAEQALPASEAAEAEAAPAPLLGPIQIRDDPPSEAPGAGVSQASILRALTQLLVEKGLITRDELIDRVHRANAYPGPERRQA